MRKNKKLLHPFTIHRYDTPNTFYRKTIYYHLRLKNNKFGIEYRHRVMRCYIANYGKVYCKSQEPKKPIQLELSFK